MNKNYLKNNKIESRKMLMDEENYELVNIFTRCAFILTDGGLDSTKTLDYQQVRGDYNMKLARLIFRYRSHLDDLFLSEPEPQVLESKYVFDV